MTIEKGTDLVLKIKDDRGNGIRVANKASFFIRVFTNDKNYYLEFGKDDVVERGNYDTVYISAHKLATLESGVIAYTYGWGINDDNFEDGEYNRLKTVYTDYYFKNEGYTAPPLSADTIADLLKQIDELKYRIDWHTITEKDGALIINI